MNEWVIPSYLEKGQSGHLQMEGVDTVELVGRYGTPLFVFSQRRILDNIHAFKMAFAGLGVEVKVCYASKANSNMAILRTVRESGLDVEVNSGGELYKVLKIGFRPEQIIFNGVAKTVKELREAISVGIYCINVDSCFELSRIIEVCRLLGKRARVAFRVIPEVNSGSHPGMETGTREKKFGISAEEILEAYTQAFQAGEWLDVIGIHAHIGSQTTNARLYHAVFEKLVSYSRDVHRATGGRLRDINIGGGIPVNYIKDRWHDEALLYEMRYLRADFRPHQVAGEIASLLHDDNFRTKNGWGVSNGIRLILEPGRSIVGDAAILLTRVQNHKVRPRSGDHWLMLDAGFNMLLESFSYKWYFHALAANKINEPHVVRYKMAGPLCDSGDVFMDMGTSPGNARLPEYRLLPAAMQEGDLIAFLDTGAYTLEQMSPYNGHPCAQAVMVDTQGEVLIIRHRDTYEGLIARDANF
jgi:diaminopimelate decarboxylase